MSDDKIKPGQVDEEGEGKVSSYFVSDKFGMILKYYRTKVKDLSLKQLEEATGITSGYLSRIESGERRNPAFPKVLQLAEVLDIPLSILLATSIQEEKETAYTPTLADVLIGNDYTVNDRLISRGKKELLLNINEFILECDWDYKSKVKDLSMLSELIDQFKEAD